MSSLIVKEYSNTALGNSGESMLMLKEPAQIKYAVAFGAVSPAFGAAFIQVQADAACRLVFGTAVTTGTGAAALALNTEFILPAGVVFTYGVKPGDNLYVNT